MVYLPESRVTEKLPLRPSERFSFSPRISSSSITSISVTAELPVFSASKVIGPAGAFAACGRQPSSVSSKLSFLAPGGGPSLDPQALAKRTSSSADPAHSIFRFIIRTP
jgi:hypothetical protein